MGENLVELAQRFVRLSVELALTRDAMKRLLLNGAVTKRKPTPAKRPGAKRRSPATRRGSRRRRSNRRS